MGYANKPRRKRKPPAPFLPNAFAPHLKGNARIEAMAVEIDRLHRKVNKLSPLIALGEYIKEIAQEEASEAVSDHELDEH